MNDEVLIKVDGLSKKFCRSLKRSLWYGIQDVTADLLLHQGDHARLRKNEFWAVNDVSFELRRGQCLGLIGPNGAGKSSLLKMLNGLVKPDRGRITINGRVGALIELGAGFNPILTARENIYVNGSVLGFSKTEIDSKFDAIVDFAEVDEFLDTPIQNFSSGMKVRLGFAIAAQMEPDVLLIDEVLAVGDVGFVAKCFNRISELMATTAVIFVSHSMPNISRICTQIITLQNGEVIHQGENVSEGIEKFFSLFTMLKKVETYSSPNASLRKIEIESAGKRNVTKLHHGDTFLLHIYCDLATSILEYSANLLIFDQNQNALIYSSSHYSGTSLKNDNGTSHVVVDLGFVNLKSGIYSIDVSITDENNLGVYSQIKAMKQFQVNSNLTGYAPIQLQGKWGNCKGQ